MRHELGKVSRHRFSAGSLCLQALDVIHMHLPCEPFNDWSALQRPGLPPPTFLLADVPKTDSHNEGLSRGLTCMESASAAASSGSSSSIIIPYAFPAPPETQEPNKMQVSMGCYTGARCQDIVQYTEYRHRGCFTYIYLILWGTAYPGVRCLPGSA